MCSAFVCSGYSGANPGYGFHSDYTHGQQYPGGRAANATGGGFWTGMGTGGVLGYLFGRQRSAKRWREREMSGRYMTCVGKAWTPRKPNVLNDSALFPFRAFRLFVLCVCFAEASPTATTTPVTKRLLLEAPPLPQEHAPLQVQHVN